MKLLNATYSAEHYDADGNFTGLRKLAFSHLRGCLEGDRILRVEVSRPGAPVRVFDFLIRYLHTFDPLKNYIKDDIDDLGVAAYGANYSPHVDFGGLLDLLKANA